MHNKYLRTTINLKDDIINEAMQLSHINNKTELIHLALKTLIAQYNRERLIAPGGTEKKITSIPRRR